MNVKGCSVDGCFSHSHSNGMCKPCYDRQRYRARRETVLATVHQHRVEDIEKARARDRQYDLEHREQRRAARRRSYWKHREKILANEQERYASDAVKRERARTRAAQWYKDNPKRALEAGQRWQRQHPEKVKAAREKWRLAHPEMGLALRHRRRAQKLAGGSYTPEEWRLLCEHYGNRCLACGLGFQLTIDHVIPLSKGGLNDISNLQPLCRSCNARKSAKIIDYRSDHQKAC